MRIETYLGHRLFDAEQRVNLVEQIYARRPNKDVGYATPEEIIEVIPLTKKVVHLAHVAVYDAYLQLFDLGLGKKAEQIIFEADKIKT